MSKPWARTQNSIKKTMNIRFVLGSVWLVLKTFYMNLRSHYIKQIIICTPFMMVYAMYEYFSGGIESNVGFMFTMILSFLSIIAIYRYYWARENIYSNPSSFKSHGIKKYYYIINSSGDRLYAGLLAIMVTMLSLAIYITSFSLWAWLLIYLTNNIANIMIWVVAITYIPLSLALSKIYFGLMSLPFNLYISQQTFKEALLNSWNSYKHKYLIVATLATVISLAAILVLILLLGQGQHWVFASRLGQATLIINNIYQYISYILIINIYILFTKSIYDTLTHLKAHK